MKTVDLTVARLDVEETLTASERKAVDLLIDEIETRTGLRWCERSAKASQGPVISVRHAAGGGPPDGFHVSVTDHRLEVQGNDERGTLFGVGRLLRALNLKRGYIGVKGGLELRTSPEFALRGHQIGYRPKGNTYDAWTPAIFEQYVRDLAVFGTNAIELVSPRSDDVDDSAHFRFAKLEMMVRMSRIVAAYGLQVWIWYPALSGDYNDPKNVDAALQEWDQVFRLLPRVDAVLVPGGDPGNTPARILMELLERLSTVLRKHHPNAQMWVSAQNFNLKELTEFSELLKRHPYWLDGVVHGPGVRLTVAELRAVVPSKYPIRLYPDIAHSVHCQYPVNQWDTAFAVTQGREIINPRPLDFYNIFQQTSPNTVGFITYSEGVNDDVNKILWSCLGWSSSAEPITILREYSRYFISPHCEEGLAQALLALERNWRGPLLGNRGVENTLLQVQALEREASPAMLLNWRFQEILYRAYYDDYIRQRLTYEMALEEQAIACLHAADESGIRIAINEAHRILDRATTEPIAGHSRTRILSLAEALFQSIRLQLSVDRYKCLAVSRGANLDTIDFPLNNRHWLKKQLLPLTAEGNTREVLKKVNRILNRTNPGPGGFYDDLGNAAMQEHLVEDGPGYRKDPSRRYSTESSFMTFNGATIGLSSRDAVCPDGPANFMEFPITWWRFLQTQYDTPIEICYRNLDENAIYDIEAVYVATGLLGDQAGKIKLVSSTGVEIHAFLDVVTPPILLRFKIPAEAISENSLTLRWSTEPGFSGTMGIAEIFLLRNEVCHEPITTEFSR